LVVFVLFVIFVVAPQVVRQRDPFRVSAGRRLRLGVQRPRVDASTVPGRVRALALTTALVAFLLPACGGSKGSSTPIPTPAPTPGPTPQNPCPIVASEEAEEAPALTPEALAKLRDHRTVRDRPGRVLNSLWLHQAHGVDRPLAEPDTNAQDAGEIAVLQDSGDLFLLPNNLDLAGKTLRFTPSANGFSEAPATSGFRQPVGDRVTLTDDDSASFQVPFAFPYYGAAQSTVFVNSDGNLTFGEGDAASTDRDVTRMLTGPPRVAPFFADLDPTTGTGRVYVQSAADAFTVTWCGVRAFDSTQTTTVQVSLLPDGVIEMHYGTAIGLRDAIVAVSPGRSSGFSPIDLTAGGGSSAAVAVGERFGSQRELDLAAVAKRFYAGHQDLYDQLLVWTDTSLVTGNAFAFETTVANDIRGIGIDLYNDSAAFGSAGRLRSMVMFDTLSKYPSDPRQTFLGENDTLSLMGQEVGHRWLAFLRFRDSSGGTSDALLGRDLAHWSFFMDSDASVMEGNDIEDLGGGTFRTVGAVSRYSRLDQYAMGLVGESDVPRFFYVDSPTNVQPSRDKTDGPDEGVTFSGTRRDVLITDVVAAMGTRSPTARNSPKVHRQAFIYVISGGTTLADGDVRKIDGFRKSWETFFSQATDRRMRAETRLRPPS
jgi:hypothetical protein